jgi:toxin-antitoxin system PIN domain toxin
MIAIDTNILVYAHRRDCDLYSRAVERVRECAQGSRPWALPWPCIHEFIAIVTHPNIFKPPTPLADALDQAGAWLESPNVVLLSEGAAHWRELRSSLEQGRVAGPKVHDARVAALCIANGVRELWTADRDFSRFPSLRVVNPLVG